jgi:hypothetical protein
MNGVYMIECLKWIIGNIKKMVDSMMDRLRETAGTPQETDREMQTPPRPSSIPLNAAFHPFHFWTQDESRSAASHVDTYE